MRKLRILGLTSGALILAACGPNVGPRNISTLRRTLPPVVSSAQEGAPRPTPSLRASLAPLPAGSAEPETDPTPKVTPSVSASPTFATYIGGERVVGAPWSVTLPSVTTEAQFNALQASINGIPIPTLRRDGAQSPTEVQLLGQDTAGAIYIKTSTYSSSSGGPGPSIVKLSSTGQSTLVPDADGIAFFALSRAGDFYYRKPNELAFHRVRNNSDTVYATVGSPQIPYNDFRYAGETTGLSFFGAQSNGDLIIHTPLTEQILKLTASSEASPLLQGISAQALVVSPTDEVYTYSEGYFCKITESGLKNLVRGAGTALFRNNGTPIFFNFSSEAPSYELDESSHKVISHEFNKPATADNGTISIGLDSEAFIANDGLYVSASVTLLGTYETSKLKRIYLKVNGF